VGAVAAEQTLAAAEQTLTAADQTLALIPSKPSSDKPEERR
jgi:hypothetical protein